MDKHVEATQSDSISNVQVKVNDYEPSEYNISEPPPAYRKRTASSVEIARIISFTLIACSLILGAFIFAGSYIEAQAANSLCIQQEPLVQNLGGNSDLRDGPSYQALQVDPLVSEESKQPQSQQQVPIQIKMPVQIDFDDLAAALIEKNQKARMNCVIEKRKSEEMMDHQSKTVALPFGVNVTTDPKYEHVTGERMTIFCESGNDEKPTEQPIRQPVLSIVPNQPQLHPLLFDQPERKPFIPHPHRLILENIDRRQPLPPPPAPFVQPNPFMFEERRFPQPFLQEERRFPQPQQGPFIPEQERKFPPQEIFDERRMAPPQALPFIQEERRFDQRQASPFMVEERRFPQQNPFVPPPQPQERKFQQPQENAIIFEERRIQPQQPNWFEERRVPQQQQQANTFVVEERRLPQSNNFMENRRPQPNNFIERVPQPQPNTFMIEERRIPQPNNFVEERRVPQSQPNEFMGEERRPISPNHIMSEEIPNKPQFEGPQIMFEERKPQPAMFFGERKQNQPQGIVISEERKQVPQFQPSQPINFENGDTKMPMAEAHTMILADNGDHKQGPITIIAREEHVIPVYQREAEAPPPPTQSRRIHLEPVPLESQQEALFKPHQPTNNIIEGRAFTNTIENLNMIIAEVAAAANNQPQEPSDEVRPPPPPFQRLPIHIPINMLTASSQQETQRQGRQENIEQEQTTTEQEQPQQDQTEQSNEQIEKDTDESERPHYVQPRSIRERRNVLDVERR